MKVFLIAILFLPLVAHASKAEKCLDQMIRFRLVSMVKGSFDQDKIHELLKKKVGEEEKKESWIQSDVEPKKICSLVNEDDKKTFEEKRQQLAKSKKIAMRDLQNKKKVSSMIYSGIGNVSEKDMDEAAICADTQKSIDDALSSFRESDCPKKTKQAEKTTSINVETMSFEQACQKIIPMMRETYKDNQECEKQKELARKPLKEISPGKPKDSYNLPGTEEASQKFIDDLNQIRSRNKKAEPKKPKNNSGAGAVGV